MKIIVGIGNPGMEYERTRHNVGFDVLDRLARRLAPGEIARARFKGATVESGSGDEKVLMLKPTTYVNCTGEAVGEAIRFYKLIPADDLLVIVDDTALPCGTIRMRPRGGDGGHNGLNNIARHLGGDEWARLRVGIDPPGDIPLKDYVLGRFSPDQETALQPALEQAVGAAECWLQDGPEAAMNRFNATD
ncbi:MAG: aminoacyl-tRNA hydrolase [Phycisphaerales bacterium]|nr:aminoacyl-tRNA hydrolase [Phycisphaerales bacterium]